MATSPSTLNLFQGKGYMMWTPSGGAERDLGYCDGCKLTPGSTKLVYKSQRAGTANTVKTVYPDKTMELEIQLAELTSENLQLLFGAPDPTANSDGTKTLYARGEHITGSLRWVGTNDVGNKFAIVFGDVDIGPSGELDLIVVDGWGQVTLAVSVNAVENSDGTSDFFTMTETPAA